MMVQNRQAAEKARIRETAALIAAASIRQMREMLSSAPKPLLVELDNLANELGSRAHGRRVSIEEIFAMGATWNPIAGDEPPPTA
jgi:hypothetical protein